MERKCNRCKTTKPLSDFYKGRNYECKECTKTRVKATRDPERARDLHYQRNYGITLATFNRMVLAQGSKCACCGTSEPRGKHNQWCVDHDHVTGTVRELLCKDCNIVLGLVEDSPEHLQRLTEYVLKHSKHNQSINND
jgi:hypothetical protein